jgi:hypothetical protein
MGQHEAGSQGDIAGVMYWVHQQTDDRQHGVMLMRRLRCIDSNQMC